ncbi:hypothetical protein TNIN_423461 [Trichonephila inaurata madagascariensis]|uniref:Uncharacterized protein n=1 Tax=Trichonephila inaurata madagascariensis TaxID=2747483 RepID=A0A8X7CLS8_9ARAC|nr:hypothetical protein TNIN_423461 [Trichonephila inaurata madagascariensis]
MHFCFFSHGPYKAKAQRKKEKALKSTSEGKGKRNAAPKNTSFTIFSNHPFMDEASRIGSSQWKSDRTYFSACHPLHVDVLLNMTMRPPPTSPFSHSSHPVIQTPY